MQKFLYVSRYIGIAVGMGLLKILALTAAMAFVLLMLFIFLFILSWLWENMIAVLFIVPILLWAFTWGITDAEERA